MSNLNHRLASLELAADEAEQKDRFLILSVQEQDIVIRNLTRMCAQAWVDHSESLAEFFEIYGEMEPWPSSIDPSKIDLDALMIRETTGGLTVQDFVQEGISSGVNLWARLPTDDERYDKLARLRLINDHKFFAWDDPGRAKTYRQEHRQPDQSKKGI